MLFRSIFTLNHAFQIQCRNQGSSGTNLRPYFWHQLYFFINYTVNNCTLMIWMLMTWPLFYAVMATNKSNWLNDASCYKFLPQLIWVKNLLGQRKMNLFVDLSHLSPSSLFIRANMLCIWIRLLFNINRSNFNQQQNKCMMPLRM